MTTKDKKRILSLPIVNGEIRLKESDKIIYTRVVPFRSYIMPDLTVRLEAKQITIKNIIYKVKNNYLELIDYVDDIRLTTKIKYSDFEIQFCFYPGISNN